MAKRKSQSCDCTLSEEHLGHTAKARKTEPQPVSMRVTFLGVSALLHASARGIERRFCIQPKRAR